MRIALKLAVWVAWLGAGACSTVIDGSGEEQPPPYAEPNAGCALGCHGDSDTSAPPMSVSGATDATSIAVGAHRQHLGTAGNWHRAVACNDCHVVPDVVCLLYTSPSPRDGLLSR